MGWSLPALLLFGLGCGERADELSCSDCNLVLVSIDTLRADRLGCYGGPRPTSPGLDALAGESLLFENALAGSYHTADSHASIFTATAPSVHEVSNASTRVGTQLAPGLATLAEAVASRGFATAGFHGGGNVSPVFGFGRGFDTYRMTTDLGEGVAWARAQSGRRFFVFLHTFHTHDPYTPAPESLRALGVEPRGDVESNLARLKATVGDRPFPALRDLFWGGIDESKPEDVAYAMALYDAEILEVDRLVAQAVREILSVAPRTLVVITSDHGEEFGEHGKFLHDSLFQEVLHVPLLIRHPARMGRRVAERVSLIDLAPTLLDLLGVEIPPTFQGRSFAPALAGGEKFRRSLIAEKMLIVDRGDGVRPTIRRRAAAAILGDEKVLFRSPREGLELYDLAQDPGERSNLAATQPARLAAARAGLDRILAGNDRFASLVPRGPGSNAVEIPRELEEQLRALGYLN